MRPKTPAAGIALITALLAIALVVAASAFGCEDDPWTALFKPHLGEYLEIAALQLGHGSDVFEMASAQGYLRGKLVVVNESTRELSPLNELLVDLRAVSPEEVGTVVLLSYFETTVGNYVDGSRGLQQHCGLTVCDFVEKKIVCMRLLEGTIPWMKECLWSTGDKSGSEVSDDLIVGVLRALPQMESPPAGGILLVSR